MTTITQPATPQVTTGPSASKFYQVTWRWHFYAGLFTIPFMLILAITGAIYLFRPQLDDLMYPNLLFVQPTDQAVSYAQQFAAVQAAYPDGEIWNVTPPKAGDRSTQFNLTTGDGRELAVFVNPYTGVVLGERDEVNNLQAIALNLHGSLLIGDFGDRLLEISAGWGIILVITGLYLWWPRQGSKVWGVWLPRLTHKWSQRTFWRDLHSVPAAWASVILLFFLITGLPWTGVWGDQITQSWNHHPEALYMNPPQSDRTTADLELPGDKRVPWAVQNVPVPASSGPTAEGDAQAGNDHHGGAAAGTAMSGDPAINLDSLVAFARAEGVPAGYNISLPQGETGVWTIGIFADNPQNDRTIHIDQYSGKVLADVGWDDYNLIAQSVSMGTQLHQGRVFGLANQLIMLAGVLVFILVCITAVVMWWIRRPSGKLGAPPMPKNFPVWKTATALMILLGILFPLTGLTLLGVLAIDYLIIQRVPVLQARVG